MTLWSMPEIIVMFLIELLVLLGYLSILGTALSVIRFYDRGQSDQLQYRLEKKSYYASTVIQYALLIQMVMLPYWVYTLDKLSIYIPGAMCAAGVVNANEMGNPLMLMHLAGVLLAFLWLTLHFRDVRQPDYPYIRLKYWLFLGLLGVLGIKIALMVSYLDQLDPSNIVQCCSLLYGETPAAQGGIHFSDSILLMLFYGSGFVLLLSLWKEYSIISMILAFLFLGIAIQSIVQVFSPYVYELPTHQCPYCLFQKEYGYVGYPLFFGLISGTFGAVIFGLMKSFLKERLSGLKKVSMGLVFFFIALCSFYPVRYYLVNGVWL